MRTKFKNLLPPSPRAVRGRRGGMSDTINYPLLKEMIDCVAREVALRFAVYPKRVQIGKMTKEQADREIMLMQMIRNSLKKFTTKKPLKLFSRLF